MVCPRSEQTHPLALEAAIMALTLLVEQRGSAEVVGNVRATLDTINTNKEFINMTLTVLMAPEGQSTIGRFC